MARPNLKFITVLLLLSILPTLAQANAGTPLMWLTMLHLAVGNLFIGLFEGLLISRILGVPKRRSILIMILANYFSAMAGGTLLYLNDWVHFQWLEKFYFENLRLSICLIYLILVVLTIFLEWPFCQWAQTKLRKNWRRAFFASVVVQISSYILITPLYFFVSSASITRPWTIAKANGLANINGFVLYIDSTKHTLNRIDLSNFQNSEVLEVLNPKVKYGHLFLDLSGTNPIAVKYAGSLLGQNGKWEEIQIDLKTKIDRQEASSVWQNVYEARIQQARAIPSNEAYKLRSLTNCWRDPIDYSSEKDSWKINRVGSWAIEGIEFGSKNDPKETINLAVESPPFWWQPSCATALPGDVFIFSLGNSIVLANLKSKELSWIALGRSPVVVLKRTVIDGVK